MSPLLFALASALLRVWASIARPRAAECPKPMWLAELWSDSGRYVCAMPVKEERPAIDAELSGIEGRIYCEGRAVQVGNGRAVRCAERTET